MHLDRELVVLEGDLVESLTGTWVVIAIDGDNEAVLAVKLKIAALVYSRDRYPVGRNN